MKKNKLLSAVFTLFLLVPASMTWAQTVSSQKGLTTVVFTITNGSIKVYLPDDIRPGDIISGRIVTEPIGNSEKQIAKNLAELKKCAVIINKENFSVADADKPFQISVPAGNPTNCRVELINGVGVNAGELSIPPISQKDQQPQSSGCNIPSHALTGAPFRITGSFDGNSSNTNCNLNNNPLPVLAESPRQCIVSYPTAGTGMNTLNIQESGKQPCTGAVSGVKMNLSAGKLNLLKGEKTYINVEITGLQNLPDTAMLTLINITNDIVTMQPSNNVVILLAPDSVGSGTFNRRFDLQSIKTGTFSVNVNLELPGIMLSPVPGDNNSGRCQCSINAEIVKRSLNNSRNTYNVVVAKNCLGKNCSEKSISYLWKIVAGQDNGEIVDQTHTKQIVTVQPKGSGNYTLQLTAILTCSDGSSCTTTKFTNAKGDDVPGPGQKIDTPLIVSVPDIPKNPNDKPDPKACSPVLEHIMIPMMDGGLVNTYPSFKTAKEIRRDDFIILEAAGMDADIAKLTCVKMLKCPDAGCIKETPIAGKVRFEWIINGDAGTKGSFVQIGCIPDEIKTVGEHVIFKPPYVPLPLVKADTTVITTITLSVIDAGSPVLDPVVNKLITITTKRAKGTPDFYSVTISGGEYKPTKNSPPPPPGCACKPEGPAWSPGDNLKAPDIILPSASTDNDKLVLGQWVILTTSDQTDKDIATYGCTSASACPTGIITQVYDDVVRWKWKVEGGGRILLSDTAQYVVYEAPTEFPKGKDFIDVKITLSVYNPPGRTDPSKDFVSEKVFRVYKPGIRLNYPPLTWLPGERDTLELKSELVYESNKTWLPAFDHMGRIQYFELMNVSQEKGICLNYPTPDKANQCFDLQLKKDSTLEAFAPSSQEASKCTLKDQFMQARTAKPVREYSVKIYSFDYGAYGFIRSFANINNGMSGKVDKGRDKGPVEYRSVEWKRTEVLHPLGGKRVKLNVYQDNRVNVPYDVDENHVADNGWTTLEGKKINDPEFVFNDAPPDAKTIKDAKKNKQDLFPANDNENIPLGDGFRGDGYGSYEEYRGFKIISDHKELHVRTDIEQKDIFICNEDNFELDLYMEVSGLGVYEINHLQFESIKKRAVNFNFSRNTHLVDQFGLYLVNRGYNKSLMGIARSNNGKPTIPNFENEISIYKDKIIEVCKKFGLDEKKKIQAVVAHELLHANNVCHHGEGDESVEKSHDLLHGLRSGDIYCVMHYDNSGNNRDIDFIPEPLGKRLCTSPAGTGYNAPDNANTDREKHMYFGSTLEGRGNCAQQIRVSGRGGQPTPCGDRFDTKNELKKEFKDKSP